MNDFEEFESLEEEETATHKMNCKYTLHVLLYVISTMCSELLQYCVYLAIVGK